MKTLAFVVITAAVSSLATFFAIRLSQAPALPPAVVALPELVPAPVPVHPAGLSDSDRAKILALGESTVRMAYPDLLNPMWLRGTYALHEKRGYFVVEGIVLEGKTDSSDAYFWAVEIVSREGDGAKAFSPDYRARSLVFHLDLFEIDSKGEFQPKGKMKPNHPYTHAKLDFD